MFPKAQMIIESTPAALAHAGALFFKKTVEDGVRMNGRFTVALSGGTTPQMMYAVLAQEPFCSAIPWDRIDIFWVDERCVPVEDSDSNYGRARTHFLDQVPIPADHVHPMPAHMTPPEAAAAYQKELDMHLPKGPGGFPVLDLILLGMGSDGHTASLLPADKALDEWEKWVVTVRGGTPDLPRLSLTLPVLNRGRKVVFMVTGASKAQTVRFVLEEDRLLYPAQSVQPLDGKLVWLLDKAAASMLTRVISHEAF